MLSFCQRWWCCYCCLPWGCRRRGVWPPRPRAWPRPPAWPGGCPPQSADSPGQTPPARPAARAGPARAPRRRACGEGRGVEDATAGAVGFCGAMSASAAARCMGWRECGWQHVARAGDALECELCARTEQGVRVTSESLTLTAAGMPAPWHPCETPTNKNGKAKNGKCKQIQQLLKHRYLRIASR